MNIMVVGIDPDNNVPEQLRKIAESIGMDILSVTHAFQDSPFGGQPTALELGIRTINGQRLLFNRIPPKVVMDEEEPPEKHDWNTQRERNKFFNRKGHR